MSATEAADAGLDQLRVQMPVAADVVVHAPGRATDDLPREVALAIDLPETAAHRLAPIPHLRPRFMASRGAVLASEVR